MKAIYDGNGRNRAVFMKISVVGLVLLAAATAQGALVAYEGFNYPIDAALVGQSGGMGWDGPWKGPKNAFTIDDNLVGGFGALVCTGNNATVMAPADDWVTRKLKSRVAGYVVWLSFLAKKNDAAPTPAIGLGLWEGQSYRYWFGSPQPFKDVWSMRREPGGKDLLTDVPLNELTLVVASMDMNLGNIYLWVNPSLNHEPDPKDAAAVYTVTSQFRFDTIALSGGFGSSWSINEIRLGESWIDVAPGAKAAKAPKPEPTAKPTPAAAKDAPAKDDAPAAKTADKEAAKDPSAATKKPAATPVVKATEPAPAVKTPVPEVAPTAAQPKPEATAGADKPAKKKWW